MKKYSRQKPPECEMMDDPFPHLRALALRGHGGHLPGNADLEPGCVTSTDSPSVKPLSRKESRSEALR